MPKEEYDRLRKLRWGVAKLGDKNPMYGKFGSDHHNYIGECDDHKGYLTKVHNGKRRFVHRIVMAEYLGLIELPDIFDVHHIDEDLHNNDIDNLTLVTPKGHRLIHSMYNRLEEENPYDLLLEDLGKLFNYDPNTGDIT